MHIFEPFFQKIRKPQSFDPIQCLKKRFVFKIYLRNISYRYPNHELEVAELAKEIGFTQISVSHRVSPLMRIVSRGETTVVDAYLSPVLNRYITKVKSAMDEGGAKTRLMFMQSNGGLADVSVFQGKDSILSGPTGGIIGAVATSKMAGYDKIISFDMGGTSTDVAHYSGEYGRSFETDIAGIHLRTPMMYIHTVAAGGGSILHFDGKRFRVGPDSAGADPGPACYRRSGPLTVTDCNLMLHRLLPEFFPNVFGTDGDQYLDMDIVLEKFSELTAQISSAVDTEFTPEQVAEGFLTVAVENMSNAIKKISIQRGYNIKDYTLCCFGGAGGQHACCVADSLGIQRIFIHPYAGVLSAYGMGLADIRTIHEYTIESVLDDTLIEQIEAVLIKLGSEGRSKMMQQGLLYENIKILNKVHVRYEGTDTSLVVDFSDKDTIITEFNKAYKKRFGFTMEDKAIIVEAVSIEVIGRSKTIEEPVLEVENNVNITPIYSVSMYTNDAYHTTPVFRRGQLKPGSHIQGPAIIVETTTTIIIEPGWQAEVTLHDHLILTRIRSLRRHNAVGTVVDPVMLEIFNNRFMSIAEQMGYVLQNTAYSVNIKERLDFSCAIFDKQGSMIANAPHIPVHLGSMGESVQAVIRSYGTDLKPGDVYLINSPFNGGTHLPDITVITPLFKKENDVLFYVASRGHHADIGSMTPGSMPPMSRTIHEEGVLSTGLKLMDLGHFCEQELLDWLRSGTYPARNPRQNIADIRAQIAANKKGIQELQKLVDHYSLDTVRAYMGHVQDNAKEAVCRVLDVLKNGNFTYTLDNGSIIKVRITIDRKARRACVDFTGTTRQLPDNFNAPAAVCKAAVLYVFRTLVQDDIPLNDGCIRPIDIIIPEGSMLNPQYPAAVVGGNVETSQYIVDALFGALGVIAASQGTMNNFTFGNDSYQYYETICGGSGAGDGFDGTDAVQTHMTNSRITDPEVLEWRFPVLLESFSIRHGSGGRGKYSGGCGVIRKIRFLETMSAGILSSHRVLPPFGLKGGGAGSCGCNRVVRSDGTIVELNGQYEVEMHPGDVFVIETPGGGGYLGSSLLSIFTMPIKLQN